MGKKYSSGELVQGIMAGVLISIFFMFSILAPPALLTSHKYVKLGNAICQENFGESAEFKSFDGKVIECEKPEKSEKFDELRVRLE